MGKAISGDFIGFTFNGVHSSTLGICRVSDGSRYTEDLLPTYQDKVVEAPGTDETYYFGTYYKQKIFQISFVFDSLSESQIRKLKQLFSDKQIHELWFDETPYKGYNVKVNGIPTLKYICFDEKNEFNEPIRVYKGEGNVSFIAYYPFAHSRFKYLNQYSYFYGNKNEWAPSSGLKIQGNLDKVLLDKSQNDARIVNLWNAGDLETDFKLNIYFEKSDTISEGKITLGKNQLKLSKITKKGSDEGVQINSRLKLLQGFTISDNQIVPTSNIYNEYINSGDFFKIPLGGSTLKIKGLYGSIKGKMDIDYKYWYL